jgi:plastocyanin
LTEEGIGEDVMKSRVLFFLVLSMVFVCGCQSQLSGGNGSGSNLVVINSSAFDPPALTIAVGENVVWKNADTSTLSISVNGPENFSTPAINPGAIYSRSIIQAGNYSYSCDLHPNLTGQINAQ